MGLSQKTMVIGAALVATLTASHAATVDLPASAALPAGTSTVRGFLIKVAQGPESPLLSNNATRALNQVHGTLLDEAGVPVPNQAFPGPLDGGIYSADTANFEKDGNQVDIVDADQNPLATFFPFTFPGIPGSEGHTENFSLEAIGFVELPAGVTTFGVSTTTERTDNGNDDGFVVTVGTPPGDFFGLKVGEFQRNAPPFAGGYRNESQFSVNAPVAGIYPVRMLFWQTSLGSSLQWYTILETGERLLLNDSADPRALKVYQDTSVAAASAPYVGEVTPLPGSAGNSPSAPIDILLVDGSTTVATTDVALSLNGTPVNPQVLTKANGQITISYSPNATRPESDNLVKLTYRDSAGVSRTNQWNFTITTSGGEISNVTGQWDFDHGNLAASVGQDLEYLDGPNGLGKANTTFGTTTSFGIPDIGGKPASVVHLPGRINPTGPDPENRASGLLMHHGIPANGGGSRVNQYTIIYD
ncbi:MAG TPA: hypothetical protein PLX89_21670, partial [Verrucomicrobiota bacterium]|nr:hypothetical protein [Verrucomicrobiota bacterium]